MTKGNSFFSIRKLFQLIGIGFLLSGVFFLWAGLLEIYTYYAFIPGGKFHFEGFGVGSFMFAYITVLVMGYYALALLCLSLGYGHLTLHQWTRNIMLTLLWDWIILGLPLSIIGFLMLFASKSIPTSALPFLGIIFVLIYPIFPLLMIKFYNLDRVRQAFRAQEFHDNWIVQTPLPVLILTSLMGFFIVVLHFPLLLNGIFPLFGKLVSEWQGVHIIAGLVILMIFLAWGTLKRRGWAWWGSIILFCLLIFSSSMTFSTNSYQNILALMKFAPDEQKMVQNMPFQGYHLLIFFAAPLLITLIIIIFSKKYFTRESLL